MKTITTAASQTHTGALSISPSFSPVFI